MVKGRSSENLGSTIEYAVVKAKIAPRPVDSIQPSSEDQHWGHSFRGAKIRAWQVWHTCTRSFPCRVPSQKACVQGCTSGRGFAVPKSTSGLLSRTTSCLLSPDRGDVVEPRPAGGVLVGEAAPLDLALARSPHELPGGLDVARRPHSGTGVPTAGGVADGGPGDVAAERHPSLREIPCPLAGRRHTETFGHGRMGERIGQVDVPEVDIVVDDFRPRDRLFGGDPPALAHHAELTLEAGTAKVA